MPDTSGGGDLWTGGATGLSVFVIAMLTWLGNRKAGKDQANSPTTSLPEVAGVSMALIDAKVQAEILRETKRTADAIERVETVMREFIQDVEEKREQAEKEELEERAQKAEREVERLSRLIDDPRRGAGPYTTEQRSRNLLRDEDR